MTAQTVPNPTDTGDPQTKRVDELEPGDWLSARFTHTNTDDAAEVLSVHPNPNASRVLVVYTASSGTPVSKLLEAHLQADIASADEIADYRSRRNQDAIADQLETLADLVRSLKLPLSIAHGKVQIANGLPGIAAVAELGKTLDIEVAVDSVGRNSVFWPKGRKSYDPGVMVEWFAYDPDFKKPEAADPDHGRTTAALQPKPDTLMVPHGDPARTTFTRYFSFGHGQTDPATGENLLDKYVTVIAPTAEGCREAMLASRFGREWSMEYIPGARGTDEWIASWTEHERIIVTATEPDGGCE